MFFLISVKLKNNFLFFLVIYEFQEVQGVLNCKRHLENYYKIVLCKTLDKFKAKKFCGICKFHEVQGVKNCMRNPQSSNKGF